MSKLLFLGDLFYDYDYIAKDIDDLSKWIKENQYRTIVNLEGGINLNKGVAIEKRGPNLASNIKVIEVLKKLNVVGVCLANNHIMDFGTIELENTINLLRKNGIKYFGAGRTIKEALQPMRLYVDGKEICVFGFGWNVEETVYATDKSAGCAPRNEEIILSSIQDVKASADQVIVCLHWGFEYNRLPMPYDIKLGHNIIRNGAEIIIGHHPHCIQPKEVFCGKHIYYSLGNFYFSGRRNRYRKSFDEKVQKQSDYGLMVIYDIENGEIKEELIEYSHQEDKSVRIPCDNQNILENISGVDYKSNEYLLKVKKRKLNINPILTTDERKNRIAIKRLFFIYKLKSVVKKLLKRR